MCYEAKDRAQVSDKTAVKAQVGSQVVIDRPSVFASAKRLLLGRSAYADGVYSQPHDQQAVAHWAASVLDPAPVNLRVLSEIGFSETKADGWEHPSGLRCALTGGKLAWTTVGGVVCTAPRDMGEVRALIEEQALRPNMSDLVSR